MRGDTTEKFYTYYKLQGSQTTYLHLHILILFYTYYKLQGSQTAQPKSH